MIQPSNNKIGDNNSKSNEAKEEEQKKIKDSLLVSIGDDNVSDSNVTGSVVGAADSNLSNISLKKIDDKIAAKIKPFVIELKEKELSIISEQEGLVEQEESINEKRKKILEKKSGTVEELKKIFKKTINFKKELIELKKKENQVLSINEKKEIVLMKKNKIIERRKTEETRWNMEDEIEKIEKQIQNSDKELEDLNEKKNKINLTKKEIEEIKNKISDIKKKTRFELELEPLLDKKKITQDNAEYYSVEIEKLSQTLNNLIQKETFLNIKINKIEEKEKETIPTIEKRKVEKERWDVEDEISEIISLKTKTEKIVSDRKEQLNQVNEKYDILKREIEKKKLEINNLSNNFSPQKIGEKEKKIIQAEEKMDILEVETGEEVDAQENAIDIQEEKVIIQKKNNIDVGEINKEAREGKINRGDNLIFLNKQIKEKEDTILGEKKEFENQEKAVNEEKEKINIIEKKENENSIDKKKNIQLIIGDPKEKSKIVEVLKNNENHFETKKDITHAYFTKIDYLPEYSSLKIKIIKTIISVIFLLILVIIIYYIPVENPITSTLHSLINWIQNHLNF